MPWRIEAIRQDVRLHEVDFGDGEFLSQRIEKIRPEWIFHLATYGAYSYQKDLKAMVQTNIIGTINLVEACIKIGFEAFVNTGSSSEYGVKDHAPSEQEWLEPNSHYAVTKASATLFCRHTAQRQGVYLPTLRLYSVYGPYEEPTRLIPTLIVQGVKGKLPPLVNPTIARDYVFVDDAVEAYLLAATHPNQECGAVYNVGTGVQTSLREVVELTRRLFRIKEDPSWGSMPEREWDTDVWVSDNRNIREALGWQPRQTFHQGFSQTVQWFSDHPAMMTFYDGRP
jgi:nucleoside-diphosphate-sugar epimerase